MSATATIPKSCGPRIAASRNVNNVETRRSPQVMAKAQRSGPKNERVWSFMQRSGGADLVGRNRDLRRRFRVAGPPAAPLAPDLPPGGRARVGAAAGQGDERAQPRPAAQEGEPEAPAAGAPVLAQERRLASEEEQQLVLAGRGRDADLVHDDGVRGDGRAVAERPGAEGEVGVLPVHEEARVEAAELVPERAWREQEAAGDDVDLAHGVPLPASERLGVEERAALERRREQAGEA